MKPLLLLVLGVVVLAPVLFRAFENIEAGAPIRADRRFENAGLALVFAAIVVGALLVQLAERQA